jgi:hypothetical protein
LYTRYKSWYKDVSSTLGRDPYGFGVCSDLEGNDAMTRAALAEISIRAGRELQKGNSRPPTAKEGGIIKMEQNSQGLRLNILLSPAALRIELLGIVALVLILGRILPDFGKLLLQFSQFLFR